MKSDYTDIIIVLDRSGSMDSIKDDMVNGLKAFIKDQKKGPGECKVTLIQFDSTAYEVLFTATPIKEVKDIKLEPRGCTPLLDSVGRAITEAGSRFEALSESERPEFVIVMIITDGYENASREYNRQQINDMIKHQIEKYNWNFTYLGANQDAFAEAASIGIPVIGTMTFKGNSMGVQSMYNSVSSATSALRNKTAAVMSYNKSDYDAQDEA